MTTDPDAGAPPAEQPLSEQPLELEIPPDTAHLSTARLFAAAVGRHFGADEEAIEDLKLGVSEAVAAAAEDGSNGGTTMIAVRREGEGALAVEVRWGRAERAKGTDAPLGTAAVGLAVVGGLFPDTEVTEDDGGSMRVRFTAALRSPGATADEEPSA